MTNELKLAVKCPACSHSRLQTLRQIKAQAQFTCHDCGYQVALQTDFDTKRQAGKRSVAAMAGAI